MSNRSEDLRISEFKEQLLLKVEGAAYWRSEKAVEWPDDERNIATAMTLETLGSKLLKIPLDDPVLSELSEIETDHLEDADFLCELTEQSSRYVRRYGGFDHGTENPEDFLRGLLGVYRIVERDRLEILPEGVQTLYENSEFNDTLRISIPDFSIISDEVIAYCAGHPEVLDELHWRKFEELLDSVFTNLGYVTELGPGAGDHGIDLRIIQKDSIGELLTLVQAKRYKKDHPVGLQAVQALYGAVNSYAAHRGLFVTTSRYLPGVHEFASRHNERLILADSNDVAGWCKTIMSRKKA